MPRLLFLTFLLLLCRCSSKHQPQERAPFFFDQPEEIFSTSQMVEMSQLESKSELLPLEKARLLRLYQIEKNNLRESSTRASILNEKILQLKPEAEAWAVTLPLPEEESPQKEPNEKSQFSDMEIRQEMKEAYRAWNHDDNESALARLKTLIEKPAFPSQVNSPEKKRIYHLFFRVAFDLGDSEKSDQAFQLLKTEESCGKETAQSGFLLSLLHFAQGRQENAWNLLVNLCDSDSSLANQVRKAYWLFRFSKPGTSEKQKYFEQVISSPLPGFYAFLAKAYQGESFEVPSYREEAPATFSCPSSAEKLIEEAETRIRFSMRKDAVKLLLAAKKELLPKAESYLEALIYIARLFQASGNHLEAMKLINSLWTGEGRSGKDPIRDPRLASEFIQLYHKPFEAEVEWGAKTWGIDPDFVYSIMRQESAFNPGAVSVAGARGLMQMMPLLGKFLMEQWKTPLPKGKSYLFMGKENIRVATYHLHQLERVAPHPALIAAAYNAGIQRVSGWWRRFGQYPLDVFVEFIPVHETRNYVKLVLRNYIYYSGIRHQGRTPSSIISLEMPPSPYTAQSISPQP